MERILLRTMKYSEVLFGELGVQIPGLEIELDADKQEVRVYQVVG